MDHAAYEEVIAILDVLRRKYVPDEGNRRQSKGQLGFDYGYHQALAEVQSRVHIALVEEIVRK